MTKNLSPSRIHLLSEISRPQYRFSDIPKATLRKALKTIFKELGTETCRECRAVLVDLRQMLTMYLVDKEAAESSPRAEDARRWHADVNKHSRDLVRLIAESETHHFLWFDSLIHSGEDKFLSPTSRIQSAIDMVNLLDKIGRRAEDFGTFHRNRKDWPFAVLLEGIGRLYSEHTGKEPRVSTTLEGKNTGPFVRLMSAVCDLIGEHHRTNEALAQAFRRVRYAFNARS